MADATPCEMLPSTGADLSGPGDAPLDRADPLTRIKAGCVDGIIAFLPGGVASALAGTLVLNRLPLPGILHTLFSGACVTACAAAVFLLVNRRSLERDGQTYGKRLFGIRIAGPDGGVPPLSEAFGKRWLAFFGAGALIPYLGFLVPIADLAMMFVRPDGRCLHDLYAGTRVVKVRSGARR